MAMPHTRESFFAKSQRRPTGCLEWTGYVNRLGYGIVGRGGHLKKAHRAAWEFVNGPIPGALHVLHRCDNRSCINPSHLFLGTQADNMRDAAAKQRIRLPRARGEANGAAKLTDAMVQRLREDHAATGLSFKVLASQYHITTMTAWRAIRGHSWSHR